MKIIETEIPGVLIVEPRVFNDARGYFFESYSERLYKEAGVTADFVQDNESCSSQGVLRGLHFQAPPFSQAKLVRCVKGEVLDIAVDIRKGSPTYGKSVIARLTESNHLQFYVPRGFAHGFAVLSEVAIFQYKCDNYYHPQSEGGLSIFDTEIWSAPLPPNGKDWILSEKDLHHPLLKDFESPFTYGEI